MRNLLNVIFIVLLFAIGTSSQDKPKEPLKLSDISTSLTIGSTTFGGVAMTCAGTNIGDLYDGAELYDCKLENGHTLDGIVRVFMRVQRDQYERCEADKKAIFKGWDHTLKEFKRSIPKPIPQDRKQRL